MSDVPPNVRTPRMTSDGLASLGTRRTPPSTEASLPGSSRGRSRTHSSAAVLVCGPSALASPESRRAATAMRLAGSAVWLGPMSRDDGAEPISVVTLEYGEPLGEPLGELGIALAEAPADSVHPPSSLFTRQNLPFIT